MPLSSFSVDMIPRNAYPAAFLVVFIITLILSIMFIFHWRKYALHPGVSSILTVGYTIVTLVLLAASALLLSAVYFS